MKSEEEEPDLGTPQNLRVEAEKSLVLLQGTKNFTMVTRSGKKVGVVVRNDEPFVLSGPREWDSDEKCRQNPEDSDPTLNLNSSTMEMTKHVVTYFSSDLNVVPVIRQLCSEQKKSEPESMEEDISSVKVEPSDIGLESNCDDELMDTDTTAPTAETQPEPVSVKVESIEKSSEQIVEKIPPNGPTINNNSSRKLRKLTDVLGRLTNAVAANNGGSTNCSDSSSSFMSALDEKMNTSESTKTATRSMEVMANGFSDNAVNPDGESSNQSLTTGSEDCDNNTNATTNTTNLTGVTSQKSESPMSPTGVSNGSPTDSPAVVVTTESSENCSEIQLGDIKLKDSGCSLKRKKLDEFEDECYTRDESSLNLVGESQDSLARRCLSLLNILRNLTFVPGNDIEFGKNASFLSLLGKLLLLHHDHPLKGKTKDAATKLKEEEEAAEELEESGCESIVSEEEDGLIAVVSSGVTAVADIDTDSCSSLATHGEWWWEYIHYMREHVLVMLANISGQMDLSQFSEEVSRPIFDGLLHWAVCPAAYGQDPFPTLAQGSNLSPQRLAVEALCKLSVTQRNVDLLLATPPYGRIEKLCAQLCRSLCRTEDGVMREFSVNLLCYLSGADSGVARTIALQNPCISLLIAFIEQVRRFSDDLFVLVE